MSKKSVTDPEKNCPERILSGNFCPFNLIDQLKHNYETLTEPFEQIIPSNIRNQIKAEQSSWELKQLKAKLNHKHSNDKLYENQKTLEENQLKYISEIEGLKKIIDEKDDLIAKEKAENQNLLKDYEYILNLEKESKKQQADKFNEINQLYDELKKKEKNINCEKLEISQIYEAMKNCINKK